MQSRTFVYGMNRGTKRMKIDNTGVKRKIHSYIRWLLVFAFILTLTGCAGETPDKAVPSARLPKLDIWIFFDYNTPGTHYLDLWEQLGEEFGYELNVKTFATEELKDKLRISLACDELPDVFAVWGGSFPEFLFDAGACLPVQEYIDASGFSYASGYVSAYRDGNTYIIPCLVEAYAVTYCNRGLMEQMGLSAPKDWQELLDFVDAVNAYNRKNSTDYPAIGFGNKDSWLGELLYTMIVNRENPYALDELMRGKISFTDDVFLDAAAKIDELNRHHAFAEDFMQTGEVESAENFVKNGAVLMPHQSTIVYYLMENMGEDAIELIQFPDCSDGAFPDYEAYLMNANHEMTPGLCINKKTAYADDAAKICLEFSRRVNEINVTNYGYLNYMNDSSLSVPENLPEPVRQFRAMVDNRKHDTSFWYAVMPKENADKWQNYTKKLYAGVLTPEEFVKEVEGCLEFSQ